MSKRILIDIDGTIADWEQQFISLMTEHHPHVELFPHGTRTVSDREREEQIRALPETQEVLSMPDFYSSLKWYEGAAEAILRLEADGHDIHFCTMPSKMNRTSASEKILWITETLGDRWASKVTITYHKGLMDADLLIDDHIQHKYDNTRWEQALYTQSYNKHIQQELRLDGWRNYTALTELIAKV